MESFVPPRPPKTPCQDQNDSCMSTSFSAWHCAPHQEVQHRAESDIAVVTESLVPRRCKVKAWLNVQSTALIRYIKYCICSVRRNIWVKINSRSESEKLPLHREKPPLDQKPKPTRAALERETLISQTLLTWPFMAVQNPGNGQKISRLVCKKRVLKQHANTSAYRYSLNLQVQPALKPQQNL